MLKTTILTGLLSLPLMANSAAANAASGSGQMQASILDPLEMTIEKAKEFCAQEAHVLKCEIIRERLRDTAAVNDNLNPDTTIQMSNSYNYEILTTNFE